MDDELDNSLSRVLGTALRISILKTIFYSLRWQGLVLVGRHSRMRINGKILMRQKSMFIVGMQNELPGGALIEVKRGAVLEIQGRVHIRKSTRVTVGQDARLSIGSGTIIGERSVIACKCRMSIGSQCAIGWNNNIMDSDMHYLIIDGKKRDSTAPVIIGNNVWTGVGVTVLKGLNIGNNSAIAAGSIVTKSVPENTLSVGAPCRVIKTGISWDTVPKTKWN